MSRATIFIQMGTLLRLCVLTLEYQAQMGTLSGKPVYMVILAVGGSGSREFQVEEKEIKGIQIGKEEVKLSLFADDMLLYTQKF